MSDEVGDVAKKSVWAAVILTSIKLVVGYFTNSLGLLAEAAHSALDLLAALITFWAVKISNIPPDDNHHFGHGKVENISALIETFLLWITCLWIVWEVYLRLTGKEHAEIQPSIWAFAVLIVSIIIDFIRSQELKRVSKKHNSLALAADALHFQSDIYSSFAVLIGLAFVHFGFPLGDTISALIVAFWTFIVSLRLFKEALDQLMDKAPAEEEKSIYFILSQITEIKNVSSLKLRYSGQILYVMMIIQLDKSMSLQDVHEITNNITSQIKNKFPKSSIFIQPEPI